MKQVVEDADTLIVHNIIEIENSTECVVTVGEDTELLVLLSALTPWSCSNIYFLKPGKGLPHHLSYIIQGRIRSERLVIEDIQGPSI